jgi:polysaccharide pyruvyl transferase WcaK-like protein
MLGYYGYQNSGDEALLSSIIHNLRQIDPTLRICVLSKEAASIRRPSAWTRFTVSARFTS